METEEEVDILMSSDVYSATLSTKSITFSRAQTGWLFREDKTVGVVVIVMILFLPAFPKSAVGHRGSPGRGIFPQTESWEFDEFLGGGRKWKADNIQGPRCISECSFLSDITSVAIYDGFQPVKRYPDV